MKSFAERMREDTRLAILRLLKESRGYMLNSSQVHMGLSMLHIPCTRAEVIEDLRFLADNGLVRMEPIADISGLYGITMTYAGKEVVEGVQTVVGVSTPAPR